MESTDDQIDIDLERTALQKCDGFIVRSNRTGLPIIKKSALGKATR
jgi:hypothetical protein